MQSQRVRARGTATREANGTRQQQGLRRWIPGVDQKLLGQIKTFFVYNFPEICEEKDLWYSFQRYGKVLDVYLPKKGDKWGKRYGFLRLLRVQNENQMVRRLNDIWFGSYKLRVKIAEERSNGRVKDIDTGGKKQHRVDKLVQPGQSYAQVVKGKEQKSQHLLIRGRTMERDERDITHRKKTPIQARQQKRKEEVASCDTIDAKKRMVENSDLETHEEVMEFTPERNLHQSRVNFNGLKGACGYCQIFNNNQ
ncbi:hypothetical protein SLA2020_061410 [Shorea laevis]